jgi:hypothetical protein
MVLLVGLVKTVSLMLTLTVLLVASLHVSYLLVAFEKREELMAVMRGGHMDRYQVIKGHEMDKQ